MEKCIKIMHLKGDVKIAAIVPIGSQGLVRCTFRFTDATNIYYMLFWCYLWTCRDANMNAFKNIRKPFNFILKFKYNNYELCDWDDKNLKLLFKLVCS